MADDKEHIAIGLVIKALEGLDETQSERVIDYVIKRFSSVVPTKSQPGRAAIVTEHARENISRAPLKQTEPETRSMDIRSLKETKKPTSDAQMAVLVAYYLKTATTDERKDAIGSEEITTYFTQAGYPLPTGKNGAIDTLNNAKRAGYLESAGRGLFRLNPVGFNLAAYNMPTEGRATSKKSKTTNGKK